MRGGGREKGEKKEGEEKERGEGEKTPRGETRCGNYTVKSPWERGREVVMRNVGMETDGRKYDMASQN